MNWKKFKTIFAALSEKKVDESRFILGIDLGNDTSVVSYFDGNSGQPELLDISGGYGKPSVPTAMQYIADTKEWVFGEYAILNVSKDVTLSSLMERLGKKEYVDVEYKSISVVNVMSLYIKELIGNINHINPKAEIVGIIVSVPSYMSQEAREELLLAFQNAGYEREVIALVPDRECVLNRYYFDHKIKEENILLLDFGSRQLRGGIYAVTPGASQTLIKTVSSLFDENVGTRKINDAIVELFTDYYCTQMNTDRQELTDMIQGQLNAFVYQHKDLLFQKNIASKPVRMYFNFVYPPFQQTITKEDVDTILQPFYRNVELFLQQVQEKNIYNEENPQNVDTVICTGGGFEMLWARKLVEDYFSGSQIVFYKNSKTVIAEGATIMAAGELDVLEKYNVLVEDRNLLNMDVGICVVGENHKAKFLPIIERNSFWWQTHDPKWLIVNEKTDKPLNIEIYKRCSEGDIHLLEAVFLSALPERPKGTTRLKLEMNFESYHKLVVTIVDMGFGELFPKSNYKETFQIKI